MRQGYLTHPGNLRKKYKQNFPDSNLEEPLRPALARLLFLGSHHD
jgi:hypothetical protein